jgi:ADP-heptose:LPS heptosyltransferase
MSKYLVMKLGAFGDLSFFLPALDQIHASDPHAEITWIVGQSYTDLVKQIPSVHRVIGVDEKALLAGSLWMRVVETLQLWLRLGIYYKQVWIGHRTRGALFLLRFRVLGKFFQLVRTPSSFLKNFRNEIVVPPLTLHESYAFKLLTETALKKAIAKESWKADYSWVPAVDPSFFLKSPYIVVHLGGGRNGKTDFLLKQWPHWSEFISKLLTATSEVVVLVGAPSELALADRIISELQCEGRLISLVGRTHFLELISVIQAAHRFIGVDSGPLHFADSLGVPSLGLYGPTSTVSWGLIGSNSSVLKEPVECSPCYQDTGDFPSCPYGVKCMNSLTPDRVLNNIKILILK